MQEVCEKLNFPGHLSVECNGYSDKKKKYQIFTTWYGWYEQSKWAFKPETPLLCSIKDAICNWGQVMLYKKTWS